MLLLACDTSGKSCSAGLFLEGKLLGKSLLAAGYTHGSSFMPMVDRLLMDCGKSYQELDFLACTVGPGSFTGIRIGVTAVKTLAAVLDKPVIAVSSLRALAHPYMRDRHSVVVPMIDARNRRVFSSVYAAGDEVLEEAPRTVEELVAICQGFISQHGQEKKLLLCGDAADLYQADFAGLSCQVDEGWGRDIQPESVAAEALSLLKQKVVEHIDVADFFSAEKLLPQYRARTQAERNSRPKE